MPLEKDCASWRRKKSKRFRVSPDIRQKEAIGLSGQTQPLQKTRRVARDKQEDRLHEDPTEDRGFYHLTQGGWIRKDSAPFPGERVETWSYQAIHLSDDAKDRIWLTRVWKDKQMNSADRKALRGRFGLPIEIQADRNITLQCEV